MNLFNLSSAQRMILFSEVNNPDNDSFYLNIRKDYDLKGFGFLKKLKKILIYFFNNYIN